MRTRPALVFAAVAAAAALSACGAGDSSSSSSPAQKARAVAPAAAVASVSVSSRPRALPVVVRAASSRYGRVLVDARGRALYLFTRDAGPSSTCSGACARAWPPYLVKSRGRGAAGARSALVGVTRRADGLHQATYAGHPLYYYIGDRSPGQILCQDVEEYGGHWWVVSPAGTAITAPG